MATHIDHHAVLRPTSRHLLDLDTTSTPATQTAQAILDHLAALESID